MRNQDSTKWNELAELNDATDRDAVAALLPLCDSLGWAQAVVARRPYADQAALLTASDDIFAGLEPAELDAALAAHPRIGDRVGGDDRSAQLSRGEQAAMQSAGGQLAEEILAGNRAYEERFDRVFLIRAAGRTPEEILTELRRRLKNTDAGEQTEVREQLRQITRLRLEGAFSK